MRVSYYLAMAVFFLVGTLDGIVAARLLAGKRRAFAPRRLTHVIEVPQSDGLQSHLQILSQLLIGALGEALELEGRTDLINVEAYALLLITLSLVLRLNVFGSVGKFIWADILSYFPALSCKRLARCALF